MNTVYLQCDVGYNRWLFEEITGGYNVVEYTIKKCRELNCDEIIAGVYNCEENNPLIEVLKKDNVEVILSDEADGNINFIHIVAERAAEFIVRVGADQVLIDTDRINEILREMKQQGMEWFYATAASCILPDIVSADCLRRYKQILLESGNWYVRGLKQEKSVKRYVPSYHSVMLYDFRANSNEGLRICKNVINNKRDVYELSEELAKNLIYRKNYLCRTGILGSWILGATDADFFYDENKKVNPWWTMPAIELVKNRLNKNFRVFEWGAGNSTLFFGQYVKEVISVELCYDWYAKMQKVVSENVNLRHCNSQNVADYCEMILAEEGEFDIILIDAGDRVQCAKNAVQKLKKDGVIMG